MVDKIRSNNADVSYSQMQVPSSKKNDLYADVLKYIFNYFVPKDLNPAIFDKQVLRPLINNSRVCKLWFQISNKYSLEIYQQILKSKEKPATFSGARALGLLYNWTHQKEKVTYLLTSQFIREKFSPLNCHLPLDIPEISYDKIKINQMMILLASQSLIARVVKINEEKKEEFETLWTKKMVNPEKQLFVSTDQTLLATQHYSYWVQKGSEKTQATCKFDVYVVQTGYLIGQISIHCQVGERFDSSTIQFDSTKFMYQREGKVWTRHYDPYLSSRKLS